MEKSPSAAQPVPHGRTKLRIVRLAVTKFQVSGVARVDGGNVQPSAGEKSVRTIFSACLKIHGDFPRFVSTAFVVRDLEEIRKSRGEDELTGYLMSYRTNIGQTYVNMCPSHVGRIILDGVVNIRREMKVAGFARYAIDNITDAWHDGLLRECISAGPAHCALAKLGD
ncbi:hypothetical protein QQS21_007908 [Conoideocrella luteorostrata]|uniref:Uncharacterized protein n=1 Tax=Conoideocrella luteorostrata TaxID=1105319 RepID=A0AAJ0FRZ4_9HYPO|nr:hypothetical protein QQS21_007908 [Conoideocrella luteorostrata]